MTLAPAVLAIGLFSSGAQWGDVVSLAGNPQGVFEMTEDPESRVDDLGFQITIYWTDGASCVVRFEALQPRDGRAIVSWVERSGARTLAYGGGTLTTYGDGLRVDFVQEGTAPYTAVLRLRGNGFAPRASAGRPFEDGRRSVTGTYAITTIWGDPIGSIVLLESDGGVVTGTITDRRGASMQIEGTVQARHVRGRWLDGFDEGEVELSVEDGGSIHGSWTRAYEGPTFFRGMRAP